MGSNFFESREGAVLHMREDGAQGQGSAKILTDIATVQAEAFRSCCMALQGNVRVAR
jgi:hypothetical protein